MNSDDHRWQAFDPSGNAPPRPPARTSQRQAGPRPRNHACTLCERAFDRPSALQQHMLTHTGERPHLCPLCGHSRFATLSNLYRHERTCRGRPARPNSSNESSGAEQTFSDVASGDVRNDPVIETPPTSPPLEPFPPPMAAGSQNRPIFELQQRPRSSSESAALELQNTDPAQSGYATTPFPALIPTSGSWTPPGEPIASSESAYATSYSAYSSPYAPTHSFSYPPPHQQQVGQGNYYSTPYQVQLEAISVPAVPSSPVSAIYPPTHVADTSQWSYSSSAYTVPSNSSVSDYGTGQLTSSHQHQNLHNHETAPSFIPLSPVSQYPAPEPGPSSQPASASTHHYPSAQLGHNHTYYSPPENSYNDQHHPGAFESSPPPPPGSNWHTGGGDLGGNVSSSIGNGGGEAIQSQGQGQNLFGHGHYQAQQ